MGKIQLDVVINLSLEDLEKGGPLIVVVFGKIKWVLEYVHDAYPWKSGSFSTLKPKSE